MKKSTELKLTECNSPAEWKTAKYFRQYYFFDKAGIKDPYTWTFDHTDHKHFVLYNYQEISGYAHIQLWPDKRSAIRIIVIEESKRNRKYGSQLLSLCEQYLKEKNSKSIHAEANPESLAFYIKNGYATMPFNDPHNYPSDPSDTAVGKLLDRPQTSR